MYDSIRGQELPITRQHGIILAAAEHNHVQVFH